MNRQENIETAKPIDKEIIQSMGVNEAAYGEICAILGRNPTIDELSTLLAMWDTSGQRQGLYTWLKGQPHSTTSHDYLLDEHDKEYYNIHEPKVKECVEIAHRMSFAGAGTAPDFLLQQELPFLPLTSIGSRGNAIYMVGNISTSLAHSSYARQQLHMVDDPIQFDNIDDTVAYLTMILSALQDNKALDSYGEVGRGGIFGTLVAAAQPQQLGFDILSYREARLDAFLFGEERGRCLATLPQENEDFFLQKMDEARLNCCMLGKVTRGRVLVDDMDFGPISDFV